MEKFYKIGFFVLLGLLLVVLGGGIYYLGVNQAKISPTSTSPVPSPTQEAESEEVTVTIKPTSASVDLAYVKENIRDAITSKNTAALEGYMTDTVSVILEATECCGSLSKTEAVGQLDYLKDATSPWNFDQTNDTIKKLKAQEPTKYGPDGAFVGIAANEYTVSFKFNADNKINAITMAVTYKLVIP